MIGTHSMKLRIDARPGEDDELVISFRTTGIGTLNAFVAGYLVPLQ